MLSDVFVTVNPPSSAPQKKHHKFVTEKWPFIPKNIPPSVGRCWNGKPGNRWSFLLIFSGVFKKKSATHSSSEDGDLQVLPRFVQQGRTGRNSCFAWLLRAEDNFEKLGSCFIVFFLRTVPWQITVKPQFGLICFPLFQIQEKTHHKKGMGKA